MPHVKHPDYNRLAAIADGLDTAYPRVDTATMEEIDAAVHALLDPLVDVDSVNELVADRTDPIVETVPELILLHPKASLRSVWIDGFTLGVLYQQRGGHVG